MTLRPAPLILSRCRLQTAIALAVAVGASTLFTAGALAQSNAAAGNGATTGAESTAAAADAGSRLTDSNIFSSSPDGAGAVGNNEGRFATNRISTAPTANQNTNNIQNTANQFRNLQRINQQFNRNNQNTFRNTQGTRTIRPSLRLGFTPKPRPTDDLRKSLGKQLEQLTTRIPLLANGRSEFAAVKFDFGKRGEVILTGEVPTDRSGRLLTNILRMEPGVSTVRNDLKIVQAAPAPPAPGE